MVEAAVDADTCPICKNVFNEGERYPFLLIPCEHTICMSCKTRIENQDKKCTPQCEPF